jgi:hypothetical protein
LTPAAIPARDENGTTNGDGVFAAIEWAAAGGAGTPTATISYTNSAGVSGRTATVASVASPVQGTFEIFTLQAGDVGIRSIQSFTWSATHTSGSPTLVLYRVLAQADAPSAGTGGGVDPITGALPQIFDDTVRQIVLFPSSTTACNISGFISEIQG